MAMARYVLLLTVALMIFSIGAANSMAVSCLDTITTPTVLTEDLHCLSNGPLINGGSLDCQGHTITGKAINAGVVMTGTGSKITDCTISSFATGLSVRESQDARIERVTLKSNTLGLNAYKDKNTKVVTPLIVERNTLGANLYQSSISVQEITFTSNLRRGTTYVSMSKPRQTTNTDQTPEIQSLPPETLVVQAPFGGAEQATFAGVATESAINGANSVSMVKTVTLTPEETTYFLTIWPKKTLARLEIIEVLPKSIAPDSSVIRSSQPSYKVLNEDLVIAFEMGSVEAGKPYNISYTIDHRIARDLAVGPFTIVSIVETISPENAELAGILSIVLAGILAFYQYLRYKAKLDSNVGLFTAIYILALGSTIAVGWIQKTIVLDPAATAYILLGGLCAGIIAVGALAVRLGIRPSRPKPRH